MPDKTIAMTTDERVTMSKDEIFKLELEPYLGDVYRRALQYTRNESDANDLTQVTMLNAFKGLTTFEVGTNARAWLLRICHNAFVNKFRKEKRGPNKVNLEERGIVENDPDWVTMDDVLFDNIMGDEVDAALNNLSSEERLLIVLVVVEGYKYKEVSDELGLELNTVRTKLFRAKNKLKASLKEYGAKRGFKDKRN